MVFPEFLDFLDFMETSTGAGPGPNPREIAISFGADGPLACVWYPRSSEVVPRWPVCTEHGEENSDTLQG